MHLRGAVHPSPARAEPHDSKSWFPLPDVDMLPELEDHIATSPAAADTLAAPPDTDAAPPSPARARPHDATAWLPLPTEHDLPSVEEMITEAPWEARPSPARAEPHDAQSWLPLPDVDSLGANPPAPPHARVGTGHRARAWAAGVAILVVLTIVASAFIVNQVLDAGNTVALRVDGRRTSIETGAATVGELLKAENVKVGVNDRVIPSRKAELRDGLTVSVLRAFPINLNLDGVTQVVYTAYASPSDYLRRELKASDHLVMRNPPQRLQADSTLFVRTKHSGTLVVDGQTVEYNDVPVLDVNELLAKYSVELGNEDYVLRGTEPVNRDTRIVDGDSFNVVRVGREVEHVNEAYTLDPERLPDHNLEVGKTRVVPGFGGVMSVTYELTRRNGEAVERKLLSRVPVAVARPTVTYYGTKADPMWDRIALCETGSNWGLVGEEYSGGLGIYNRTWDGWGGRDFASNAGLATREEQIIVAERIKADVGISAWGCARIMGYVR